MAHNNDVTAIPPTGKPMAGSAAAQRMRLHRERRRNGMRCLMVELRVTEIDGLVHKGLLKSEVRNDVNAVLEALYEHLERTLDSTP